MGLFGYFWLKMETGRSCCLGWSRRVVLVNPLLLWLILDDSSGYQPYRSLIDCWRFGGIFSLGFGVPVKPRVHGWSLSFWRPSRHSSWGSRQRFCKEEEACVGSIQLESGPTVGRHSCCSLWWAAAPSVFLLGADSFRLWRRHCSRRHWRGADHCWGSIIWGRACGSGICSLGSTHSACLVGSSA